MSTSTRRPFVRSLSLALDGLIVALERPTIPPSRRDALRREKDRLERLAIPRRPR